MKKGETGSINSKKISKSIKDIEILTNLYKRKRISTEKYIKQINENLFNLTSERDYREYLKNIGQ